jgi:hypothetical protein
MSAIMTSDVVFRNPPAVIRGVKALRKMDVTGMDIFLFADGKIKEIWVNMDTLAQARQLGWVPGP